jgi:ADP-dependent phosphofructokinase/glucokinase
VKIGPRTSSTSTEHTRRAREVRAVSINPATPAVTDALPSTTASAPVKTASKNPAAARELLGHTLELGITIEGDVASKIQHAELARGKTVDARVSSEDMQRAAAWSQQAELLQPARQRDLFGFTRVVDAKAELSPRTLDFLAHACGDTAALMHAIDHGPGSGDIAWQTPATPVELVASLVRQLALGGGASRQITVEPSLATWVERTLAAAGVAVKKSMGGAGAFAANLASAIGTESTFFSAERVPHAIAERFAPGVRAVDRDGKSGAASDGDANLGARINTSLEYGAGEHFALLGGESVRVNGVERKIVPAGTGRVILGTKAKDVKPGFDGVSTSTLEKIARDHDVFFFVGAHYLTQSPEDAAKLADALSTMKRANPSLLLHAQYVVPKVHDTEPAVWGALKGKIDSLALNSVEVAPFVDSLYDGGLAKLDLDPHLPKEAAEDAAHMLEGALAIRDALDLQRVALHGLEGDLVVSKPGMPGAVDPRRQTLALLKARQLASNKTANDSGEIKSADDIFAVVPSVRGTGLAAVHRFADSVQHHFRLSDAERDLVAERWWFKCDDGNVIHFVPSRGIHDRTGGTVSLGDTIDSAALLFAVEPKRAPSLKHASSFA